MHLLCDRVLWAKGKHSSRQRSLYEAYEVVGTESRLEQFRRQATDVFGRETDWDQAKVDAQDFVAADSVGVGETALPEAPVGGRDRQRSSGHRGRFLPFSNLVLGSTAIAQDHEFKTSFHSSYSLSINL